MYINGQPYGLVTDFAWTAETPKKPLYTIDVMEALELAPTLTKVTGSLGVMRITGTGGLEGAGMAAPQSALSRERYFSLVLKDRSTDVIIFQALRCSVTSQHWQANARGFLTGTVQFEAIDWANETALG